MKKFWLMATIVVFMLAGCTEGESSPTASTTTVTQAEGATFITTDSGDIINVTGDYLIGEAPNPSGAYSSGYNQAECTEEGYFWCSIESRCLNQAISTGSCTLSAN